MGKKSRGRASRLAIDEYDRDEYDNDVPVRIKAAVKSHKIDDNQAPKDNKKKLCLIEYTPEEANKLINYVPIAK